MPNFKNIREWAEPDGRKRLVGDRAYHGEGWVCGPGKELLGRWFVVHRVTGLECE